MKRDALTQKILVLGIDGMDPRLTSKYVAQGKLPNIKKFIDAGSARQDLMLLGGQPTVTPPMWTTLATGAYPVTHGITCFYRQSKTDLDVMGYNLDSTYCQAEQIWNVFAEAGKKTLVWHWPGSSWPPTSDSPDLYVVDGTTPGSIGMGNCQVDGEYLAIASAKTEEVTYKTGAASDITVPCVITGLEMKKDVNEVSVAERVTVKEIQNLILSRADGMEMESGNTPMDVAFSPVKPAAGWSSAPEDAKEFILLLSHGYVRRPVLILKNDQGVYDTIAIYKTKKDSAPIVTLKEGVFVKDIIDDGIKGDQHILCNRSMRILELASDGSRIKMWISASIDVQNSDVWHPEYLHELITSKIGPIPPTSEICIQDPMLLRDCMIPCWQAVADWQAAALNYLIANKGFDVIFSHLHNVDLQLHTFIRHLKQKSDTTLSQQDCFDFLERIYIQTDNYLGQFLHLLDDGWTILIVSDHALVSPTYSPEMIGDANGVNVRIMQKLGFTALKTDENGRELPEIDWTNTKAVATRGNHIYLNIKGRDKHGIVDPADQYQVEEEIMTALYGYRHPESGQRIIAMALRNRDAVLLGMGGPECGDIIYWTAEGYNYDHCDGLSTCQGYGDTSLSPIFIAAGQGIKAGYVPTRIIREVDVAPTVAVLGGVRFPAQCEGAPVYQILAEEI